jgi:hypothetical protein
VPSTRAERILALLGLALCAGLAGLVVPAWLDYRDSEPAEARPAAAGEPVRATVSAPEAAPATTAAETTEPARPATTAAAAGTAAVRLVAARGDCWLDVRREADGPSLFAGILAQGQSRSFEGESLVLELGAPSALDMTLNGEPVELPQAPATVVATPDGVAPV